MIVKLTLIQGRPLTVRALDIFGVAKSGSGAHVEFWNRPEDSDPWQSGAFVRETPGEVRALRKAALAANDKRGEV